MKILSIETSCDETAVSVIEASNDHTHPAYTILGDALYSQATLHAKYGGVYPTLAKREHQKNLVPLTINSLTSATLYTKAAPTMINHSRLEKGVENVREEEFKKDILDFLKTIQKPDIDLIAVTHGPGLEPALWTGVSFAHALSHAWNIPLTGINHMEGHITAALVRKNKTTDKNLKAITYTISPVALPILSLLISGGHTELVLMKEWFKYELVGRTRDDAVGEAFDKVARLLGLPYPGGPEVSRLAQLARDKGTVHDITLPRPMIHENSCDFSFSGLKTAVLYTLKDKKELSENEKVNMAQEFEDAVRDVLVTKTKRALEFHHPKTLVVGGGVSANTHIRKGLETLIDESFPDTSLHYPEHGLTGDNAVMIATAAYVREIHNATVTSEKLEAHGSLSLVQ